MKEGKVPGRGVSPEAALKKKPGEGLGAEKNAQIANFLLAGNYDGLLTMIAQEQDKQTACEVITRSMVDFNQHSRSESVDSLLKTAMNKLDVYADALKELIIYTWRNNLQGERFWKNPTKNETLFIDDDGELISFQGEIGTHTGGDRKGMDYIRTLEKYDVLTGPNKGKMFDGSYGAMQRKDPNSRPIKGPSME